MKYPGISILWKMDKVVGTFVHLHVAQVWLPIEIYTYRNVYTVKVIPE
jgi:hypothetical protein